ncbi:MAG: thiamine-phosphate kinase [Planctomycetota bacterium]
MRESQLLARIYDRSAAINAGAVEGVRVGPGDDCAVIEIGGETIVMGVDQVVEGRHFEPGTPVDLIARKAVGRSVSDIAAMGAKPWLATATGALPRWVRSGDALFEAMASWAENWGCPLIGGDISSSDELVLTVTTMGKMAPNVRPALRRGAVPGDGVYVTGRLGGSLASGRHLSVQPRTFEGQWLAAMLRDDLHAMIDVSDGLGLDAARLAEASGVRIELDSSLVPAHFDSTWRGALGDGEDYELLFVVDADRARELGMRNVAPRLGTPISRIGSVVAGQGCVVRTPEGEALDAATFGWEHTT